MTSSAASSETGTYLTGLPSAAPSAVATSHLRQPGRVPRAAPRAAARRGATRRQPSADRRLRALPEMSHASLGEADFAEGSLPRSPPHDRYAAAQGRRAASDRAARAAAQDPRLTTEIYGHLDVEDMRAGLDRLRIATPSAPQSAPQPVDPERVPIPAMSSQFFARMVRRWCGALRHRKRRVQALLRSPRDCRC